LVRIETSIENLTGAVQNTTQLLTSKSSLEEAPGSLNQTPGIVAASQPYSNLPRRRTLDAFSPVPQASIDLEYVKSKVPTGVSEGLASLGELSDSLSAVHFDDDKIREDFKKACQNRSLFLIPSKDESPFLIKGMSNTDTHALLS
jgi:hypothetical protein